jgi:hypothetical protein
MNHMEQKIKELNHRGVHYLTLIFIEDLHTNKYKNKLLQTLEKVNAKS